MPGFLIIQTASIGDAILATPIIEKLHKQYPGSPIDILVKKGNESLFLGHPILRETLVWDKTRKKYPNLLALVQAIRSRKYDHVINLQRFASSGMLTLFSNAGHTIGFDKNPFSAAFDTRVEHEINKVGLHEVDRNLRLIESITGHGTAPVRLYPGKADVEKVSSYLNKPFVCIAPASLWPTKQYPEEKWVSFLRKMPEKYRVFLLGSKQDVELCDRILQASGNGNVFNLAGNLSLLQTAALMKEANMNYVNDSAPQHLASAVDAPVTAIFCSTVREFGFGPLSSNSAIVETQEKLSCRPCGIHGLKSCPEKHFKCALTISDESLLGRLS